jgi:hypothetical protein
MGQNIDAIWVTEDNQMLSNGRLIYHYGWTVLVLTSEKGEGQ